MCMGVGVWDVGCWIKNNTLYKTHIQIVRFVTPLTVLNYRNEDMTITCGTVVTHVKKLINMNSLRYINKFKF